MSSNTGRALHESIATVRIDNHNARSNYTITVEHPSHDGGTRTFWRNSREMVVSGVQKHLDRLANSDIERVDVIDDAGLSLGEPELRPDTYDRTGAFAPATPAVEVLD